MSAQTRKAHTHRTEQYYLVCDGTGTRITGGQDVAPVERLFLDLVTHVRHNLAEFGTPVPNRYDFDSYSAQRMTGYLDTLDSAISLATGRPFQECLIAAVAVVAETADVAAKAAIARWVAETRPTPVAQPAWSLRTQSATEDDDLASLRERLPHLWGDHAAEPDLAISAGAVPVVSDAERKRAEKVLRAAFRDGKTEAPEAVSMHVCESGLTWADVEADEVWTADHDIDTLAAWQILRLLRGNDFTITT